MAGRGAPKRPFACCQYPDRTRQYTAAIHHCLQVLNHAGCGCGIFTVAVEIQQGQGQTAVMFEQLDPETLDAEYREIVDFLAELRKFSSGDPSTGLRQTPWHSAALELLAGCLRKNG